MSRVKIDIKDHIATVSFNRPDKMNALDKQQFEAIIDAGKTVDKDPQVRVAIMKGEGRAFCAGLDINSLVGPESIISTPLMTRTHGITNMWQQAVWVWRNLQVPVIAAVHGVAFGGGLQIMLGADIKFVTPNTKLSILETKWGIIPDMAGTQLMYHSIRQDIIKELTFTNRIFSGTEAVKYGFATHTSDAPYEDALKLAYEITKKSPSAIVKAKKIINEAPYLSAEDGLLLESKEQEEIVMKKNQLEAVQAGFEKRVGLFEDHRDPF